MRSPQVLDARLDMRLFDVHVKGVEQQAEVVCPDLFDQIQSLGQCC